VKLKISIHCLLAAFALTAVRAAASLENFDATTEVVGRSPNGFETPVNQLVTPAGTLIELPGLRPLALALSPDGRLLVTSGLTHELVVLNPATGTIVQRVAFPTDHILDEHSAVPGVLDPGKKAQISFTGLIFSPDGSRIYLANVNGDIEVFSAGKDRKVAPLFSIPLPPANAPGRTNEIPAGIAVSPDGKKLYVALNLSNRLAELDAATGRVLRIWDVGVAP
jgi:DNA-binding beta-propeller fold protein YncE